jgi:hypothetical protein
MWAYWSQWYRKILFLKHNYWEEIAEVEEIETTMKVGSQSDIGFVHDDLPRMLAFSTRENYMMSFKSKFRLCI